MVVFSLVIVAVPIIFQARLTEEAPGCEPPPHPGSIRERVICPARDLACANEFPALAAGILRRYFPAASALRRITLSFGCFSTDSREIWS